MTKCFLVDGLNLIFRCFYAIPFLEENLFPTNAILGCLKIIFKIQDIEKPDAVVFFFDKGRDARRKALLPEYKANRSEVPDPVKVQIPVIQEFIKTLGYSIVERSGCEADDLIGSFIKKYREECDEMIIYSKDKDFAQCVHDSVFQLVPENEKFSLGEKLNSQKVFEKFGVLPGQIVDYLSMIGDSADNIQGLYGVGPKTASKWLQQWGTIDNILQNISQIKPQRFQDNIAENSELLKRNQDLIRLYDDIEDLYLEPRKKPDWGKFQDMIEFYKLFSLQTQIPKQEHQMELF